MIVLGFVAPELQRALEEAAANVPGVAAAVLTPEGTWTGATGFADLRTRRPMTPSTRCYVGSISKTMTAATILILRDAGQLDVDERITHYMPGWRLAGSSAVRVRDLLTHTSGVEREGGFEYWFTGVFPTPEELRDQLRALELVAEPGTQWSYSNVGYAALGQLLTVRANEDFETVVQRRLMEPLGMLRSGPRGPAPMDLARAYTAPNERTSRDGREFAGLGARVGARTVRVYHDADAMAPAFGMYSTAEDLARFAELVLGRTSLLSARSVEQMHTLQHAFDDDPRSGWTLGFRRTHDEHGWLLRHNGWFAAFRSHLSVRPEQGIAVVVLTNADDGGPEEIGMALTRALLGNTRAPLDVSSR